MVLAGGGGRLGTHLGMYVAACDAGLAPDVVIGTCGGGLIAALIHAESDPARQLAFLAGSEMYRFWRSVQPRHGGALGAALCGLTRRGLDPRSAPRVPDLDRDSLFEVTGPWPALNWRSDAGGIDAVLLGARILYAPGDIGRSRAGRALLQEVAIGPARAALLLAGLSAPAGLGYHTGSAVALELATVTSSELTLQDAVRISLTDMIYLPPAEAAGARWLGGVVDLMPVELAATLAREVWADRKDPIPRWTLAPAWRAVLGIDALQRQKSVDASPLTVRVDNRGLEQALPESVLDRRLRLSARGVRLELATSVSESEYRQVIQRQFDEGRRRTLAAIASR